MSRFTLFRYGSAIALAILLGLTTSIAGADKSAKAAGDTPQKQTDAKMAKDTLPRVVDSLRQPLPSEHRVVVYYFHGNVRCASCRKIEAYTKEAIDSGFAESQKSGLLEWRLVNTDSSQNEHFLKDYQLYTRSVVISDLHKGKETRWKNLEKVWELLGDQSKFHAYVQSEVQPFLDSTK